MGVVVALLATGGLLAVMWLAENPILNIAIVAGSAIIMTIDSVVIELKKYKGGIDSPVLVFFAVLLLWIIFFPLYIITRIRYAKGDLPLKRKYREADEGWDEPRPQPPGRRSVPGSEKSECYLCGEPLAAGDLASRVCVRCRG